MKTTNFSIHRLVMFAKSEIMSQKRIWLLWWGTIALVMLVLYIYDAYGSSTFSIYDPDTARFRVPFGQIRGTIASMSILVTVVLISRAFGSYMQPQSASRILMLPVSKAEQFTFIAVFYFILVPLILFVTQLVIDLCFAIYFKQPNLLQAVFSSTYDNYTYHQVLSNLRGLLTYSIFLYGAIFFRRNHFVMTCLAIFCIGMLLFFASIAAGRVIIQNASAASFVATWFNGKIFIISSTVAVVVLMFVLAYRRFINFQITK